MPRPPLLRCLAGLALATVAHADHWAPNLTVLGEWDSNATNANRSSDQIDTLQLRADLLASQRYGYGRDDALQLTLHGAGGWFPRYNGLTTGAAGGRAEWRHNFGPGPLAPVLSLELAADAIVAKETGRRGTATGAALALRKRFNDLYRGTFTYEWSRRDARLAVYDRTGNEATLALDRELNERTRLTVSARYRQGDIVSYAAAPRPDLESVAGATLEVNSFERPMTAYAVDADTWAGRIALTRALDEDSAIITAYEYRDTSHSPLHYANHVLSIAIVQQF